MRSKNSEDLLELIKADHDEVRELIEILKDTEAETEEVENAFEHFCDLVWTHAKAEERVIYGPLLRSGILRPETYESLEEHKIVESLINRTHSTESADQWRARVKVAAELIEHHMEEEESSYLPELKREIEDDEYQRLAERYLDTKEFLLRSA